MDNVGVVQLCSAAKRMSSGTRVPAPRERRLGENHNERSLNSAEPRAEGVAARRPVGRGEHAPCLSHHYLDPLEGTGSASCARGRGPRWGGDPRHRFRSCKALRGSDLVGYLSSGQRLRQVVYRSRPLAGHGERHQLGRSTAASPAPAAALHRPAGSILPEVTELRRPELQNSTDCPLCSPTLPAGETTHGGHVQR